MAKKRRTKQTTSTAQVSEQVDRTNLPKDLEDRLQVVWRRIGHHIDWCDDQASWIRMFCSEARPYRQTFYWEAVANMVSDYMLEHPEATPNDVLTDCLVATQYSPSPDDRERVTGFCTMWGDILNVSRKEIERFIQADLELAVSDGTHETVARLYAIDYDKAKAGG